MKYNIALTPTSEKIYYAFFDLAEHASLGMGLKPKYLLKKKIHLVSLIYQCFNLKLINN